MDRSDGRKENQLRDLKLIKDFIPTAEGSVLVSFGNTKVICTATVEHAVPKFLRGKGSGWITAEYGMLPRSTGDRMVRESSAGKQGGRTLEIQRLIGRALRAAVDLKLLGEHTIRIDCDVIQADGGTRTTAITGACLALLDSLEFLRNNGFIDTNPFKEFIAAVSVGIVDGVVLLDLDYLEDSAADCDVNVVMLEGGGLVEIQGSAEGLVFNRDELNQMLDYATEGIATLIEFQRGFLSE